MKMFVEIYAILNLATFIGSVILIKKYKPLTMSEITRCYEECITIFGRIGFVIFITIASGFAYIPILIWLAFHSNDK